MSSNLFYTWYSFEKKCKICLKTFFTIFFLTVAFDLKDLYCPIRDYRRRLKIESVSSFH